MANVWDVIGLVKDSLRRTGLPLPAPRDAVYRWARGLGLRRRGRVVLYTGALYQLAPYINALVAKLEALERSGAGGLLMGAARAASRLGLGGAASLAARPRGEEVAYAESVLRAITRLLDAAGVEYAYAYEADGYSGVLLHDLGLEEEFERHAREVYRGLAELGAEEVVTVDPHTTYALRVLYPRFIDGYSLEVRSYIELLAEALRDGRLRFAGGDKGALTLHDPCYYARFLGIIDEPRVLLAAAGYRVVEPRRSRRLTFCCGGPAESLSPALAKRVSEARALELAGAANRVATLCPICWANLSRAAPAGLEVRDAALYLAEGLAR